MISVILHLLNYCLISATNELLQQQLPISKVIVETEYKLFYSIYIYYNVCHLL